MKPQAILRSTPHFLSSNANLNTDRWRGSLSNRIRFAVEATVHAVGADRTGIRLSPSGAFWGVDEKHIPELCTALLAEPARLDMAYVHFEATTDERCWSPCAERGRAPSS